ncbi:hypothetical protein NHX12_031613 [Muraenolepis orangiensis]|uniref:Uncharacterized protein n=1 Tax=Muraenolepis orangiensis TaxID=630683 RepID=A0A9Q0E7T6_9TELE|nr:hypothetical protein NHX12_031613 [Muraenolepis orangiensis]
MKQFVLTWVSLDPTHTKPLTLALCADDYHIASHTFTSSPLGYEVLYRRRSGRDHRHGGYRGPTPHQALVMAGAEGAVCAQRMLKLVTILDVLRGRDAVSGIGAACLISLTSQVIEHVVSGSTLADAQKVAKQSETNEVEIMKLIEKLKMERAITDQDEDKYIAQRFTRAMWGKAHTGKPPYCASIFLREAPTLLGSLYTFSMFGKDGKDGKITGSLVRWGVQQLALPLATAGGKTAVKSATKLLGADGMVFSLNESTDNWKEMLKKKHVTEDSQSLRDSAEKIEQFCKELRNKLKIIE